MKMSVDFTETYAMFNAVQKHEFPYATSQAMNFVLKKTTKDFLPAVMDRYIDKGATPYTKRGFFAYYTKKSRLSGYIAAKDKKMKYKGITKKLVKDAFPNLIVR